ncbi:MAG: four helix bundle protein [Salinivirgaceae bacterium]|jgi:four helix bundle protein
MHNFRELIVWQKARSLHKDIYNLTRRFPKEELFGLTSQLRRSSQSIPSNIAEGCGRNSDKDLCRFLDMANGSAFELETQLILSFDVDLITEIELTLYEERVKEIQKMLFSFRSSKQS